MTSKIVHFISRQVGTAYPFYEFANLFEKKGYLVHVFVYKDSLSVFAQQGRMTSTIESFEDYNPTVLPEILFTGTSEKGLDDQKFWGWANRNDILSIAWLDQPVNSDQRFPVKNKELLPQVILGTSRAVIESEEIKAIPSSLYEFGSPYLRKLRETVSRDKVNSKLIVFVTEPTTSEFQSVTGINDEKSFDDCVKFVKAFEDTSSEKLTIIMKLHPRDKIDRWVGILSRVKDIQIEISNKEKLELLSKAAVFAGMRSMLLIEAASLGIPTISFQTNRRTSYPLIDQNTNIYVSTSEDLDYSAMFDFISLQVHEPSFEDFREEDFFNFIESSV